MSIWSKSVTSIEKFGWMWYIITKEAVSCFISDNSCGRKYFKLTVKVIPFLLYVVMFMLLSLTRLENI